VVGPHARICDVLTEWLAEARPSGLGYRQTDDNCTNIHPDGLHAACTGAHSYTLLFKSLGSVLVSPLCSPPRLHLFETETLEISHF